MNKCLFSMRMYLCKAGFDEHVNSPDSTLYSPDSTLYSFIGTYFGLQLRIQRECCCSQPRVAAFNFELLTCRSALREGTGLSAHQVSCQHAFGWSCLCSSYKCPRHCQGCSGCCYRPCSSWWHHGCVATATV